MSHHVLSVCIFCFICATHTPCASHAAVKHSLHYKDYSDPLNSSFIEKFSEPNRENVNTLDKHGNSIRDANHRKIKRNSDTSDSVNVNSSDSDQDHLKKIFLKYGDGDFMTQDGFKKFLLDLNLSRIFVKEDEQHGDLHKHTEKVNETVCIKELKIEYFSNFSNNFFHINIFLALDNGFDPSVPIPLPLGLVLTRQVLA